MLVSLRCWGQRREEGYWQYRTSSSDEYFLLCCRPRATDSGQPVFRVCTSCDDDCEVRTGVELAHVADLRGLVNVTVQDDAQGVDPEITDAQGLGQVEGVFNCA